MTIPSALRNPDISIPRVKSCGLLRYSSWDALLVALAVVQAVILMMAPLAPLIAVGVWWNSNTVSHYFIHKPFFKVRALNRLFSAYLTVLLGIPQSLWRDRHVAHHAGVAWRLRISPQRVIEVFLVVGLWSLLLTAGPHFFFKTYLPAYLIGLGLCALHGHYEHAQGAVSHYGAIYNFLFFNDGYHVEHHGDPHTHWRQLPQRLNPTAQNSQWPAILRWLEPRRLPERKSKAQSRKSKVQGPAQLLNFCQRLALQELERLVLHSKRLQFFLLESHKQAFYFLLSTLPPVRRVGIVGGGLFPRTVLILRELLPQARLSVIDASYENLQVARQYLKFQDQHGLVSDFEKDIEIINESYDPDRHNNFDLLVIPLSFAGDRAAIYSWPPTPSVLIHDWIWRQGGTSRIVSLFLLKRLNLVRQSQSQN